MVGVPQSGLGVGQVVLGGKDVSVELRLEVVVNVLGGVVVLLL